MMSNHNVKRNVLVDTQGSMVKKCVVPSCGEYPYVVLPHCCVDLCRILTVSYLAILNFHVVSSKSMVQDYYGEFSMCRILRNHLGQLPVVSIWYFSHTHLFPALDCANQSA